MATPQDFQSVLAARRRFFGGQRPARGLVPDTILRSWQRCAGLGLEATLAPHIEALSSRELREACDRSEALRRVCRPELESLYAEARSTDSIVILTDAQGLILDTVGSAAFADRAAQLALRPGVPWNEAMTGTNAIGTALIERRPVEVRGAEHYFAPHRVLSCYAAPIIDPHGHLAGALDLSGHASVPHLHALGMVRFAVDQIEHRLFDRRYHDCDVLRLHKDATLLGTAHEGILVFRDYRLIAANRHGLTLLSLDWQALGQTRYSELFATTLVSLRGGAALRSHQGDLYNAQLDEPRVSPPLPIQSAAPSTAAITSEPVVYDTQLRHTLQRATRMLNAGLPVLLQGETGTGKEIFAQRLHAASSRRRAALVAINCAALPESLIEAELFGYEEGAFTGARRHGAPGLLRQADGGTLFLDEIGDMPLALQTRLLRVLQQREIVPVGGTRAIAVDFSLVCATHCDLQAAVAQNRFRADLYYRIAQYTVALRPLREHPALEELISELWQAQGAATKPLPAEILAALSAYSWPGNYRELSTTLRMLKVLAEEETELEMADLPVAVRSQPAPARHGALEAIAASAMREALQSCHGNISAAARRLGISRSTLYRRGLS